MKRLSIISVVMMLVAMMSCGDDVPAYTESQSSVYQMVTYMGDTDDGSLFDYVLDNDNGVVHLFAPNVKMSASKFEAGDRLIIRYLPEGNDLLASGNISLTGYVTVTNCKLGHATAVDSKDFATSSVYMQSLWRTGDYLNFHGKVYYVEKPDTVMFNVDESTVGDEYPAIHLQYVPDGTEGGTVNSIYTSVNISEIVTNNQYKGFKVLMDNTNGKDNNEITFTK